MESRPVDLKREQEATLNRKKMDCSAMARFLFWSMDLIYGKETTLPKVRLLEILARIPYQAWETRQYARLSFEYADPAAVDEARDIIAWGREAQDNEFWHLVIIEERMRELGIREGWFWGRLAPWVAVFKYRLFSRFLARTNIRRAFQLNAEFEDHAEHTYMQFVKDNPALDQDKVNTDLFKAYGTFASWGDVFRRIGLDERDHMNDSLRHCGRAETIVSYPS